MSTRTVFTDLDHDNEIEVWSSMHDILTIYITDRSGNDRAFEMDVDTAVKFSKALRREIGLIKQKEVING